MVPAFNREIDWKHSPRGKDYVKITFKNGSYFDNIAASERSRGKRRNGLVLEECATIDGNILSEVLIPIINVSRKAMDGHRYNDEPVNKSQIYINNFGQNCYIHLA